jgi:hypothetical protein
MRHRKRFMLDLKAALTQRSGKPLASDATIYKAHQDYKLWARRAVRHFTTEAMTAAITGLALTPDQAARLRSLTSTVPVEGALAVSEGFALRSATLDNRGRLSAMFVNTQANSTPKLRTDHN